MKPIITPLVLTALMSLAIPALSADSTYREQIKPIFDVRCSACHGEEAPEYKVFKQEKEKWLALGIGPRMDSYTYLVYFTGWPDTGALMRRLDDAKPGNMYQHLGDNELQRQQNLALFKAWVGNWTLKRFDALSKEELAGIKVAY
jgi:mono/diheme cytochrome c family protein